MEGPSKRRSKDPSSKKELDVELHCSESPLSSSFERDEQLSDECKTIPE